MILKRLLPVSIYVFALVLLGAGCMLTTDFAALVDFSYDSPETAIVGEPFEVIVSLDNLDSEAHTLLDLEVGDTFLETISLESADPTYADSYHLPLFNLEFYNYNVEIPPGESYEVVMKFLPSEVGTFSGQFNACVDSEGNCIEKTISIVVNSEL